MHVHLDEIGPEGLEKKESLSASWITGALGEDSPFLCSSPGELFVRLDRVEEVVHVRGRVELEVHSNCSRCLAPTELGFNMPFEVSLFPVGQQPTIGSEGELAREDMESATYENNEIDLSSIIHDEVLLELPMSPICSERCAGLCPNCGQNLNDEGCSCRPVVDHRWEALRRVKVD